MQLSDFWDPHHVICPPLNLESEATLHFSPRLPGRESFPLAEHLSLFSVASAPIRAIADGDVLQTEPLMILHGNNVLSQYRWHGASDVAAGARVKGGQNVGRILPGDSLHFEVGLSLYAPRCDSQYFMSLEPRRLLDAYLPQPNYTLWRGSVPLESIPLFLRRAIVAVEDRRFYQHAGIDVARIGKALLNNVRHRKIMEGASTITQQAARSALHITQRTWFRKLIEIPIALALERFHDKDKILELYFNSIYWGRGATNVASAAIDFFGKNVWELNLRECALLAALPNHPLRWEVSKTDVSRLETKAEVVLRVMRDQNVIDDFILAKARSQSYQLVTC
jgi:hypothetical protein